MNYDRVHYITRDQQNAIRRVVLAEWKPIGESANEIVARAKRRLHLDGWEAMWFEKAGFREGVDFVITEPQELDADWITEYLSYCDKPEEN